MVKIKKTLWLTVNSEQWTHQNGFAIGINTTQSHFKSVPRIESLFSSIYLYNHVFLHVNFLFFSSKIFGRDHIVGIILWLWCCITCQVDEQLHVYHAVVRCMLQLKLLYTKLQIDFNQVNGNSFFSVINSVRWLAMVAGKRISSFRWKFTSWLS